MSSRLPEEFYDILLVIENGAAKYGRDSYLDGDNPSMQTKANHASMSRHNAEHYCGIHVDKDSGLDPLLHLATRALMKYTRKKRGIE